MTIQEYQRKIIELYRDQELLIADLYGRFAERFPKYADFWGGLASEELEHAGWVAHLLNKVDTDAVQFDEGKTRSYTLTTSINHIKGLIFSFKQSPFDLKKALTYTLDLERSLIERQVFDRFAGDSPEVLELLTILGETQQSHLRKIEARVTEIRAKFAA